MGTFHPDAGPLHGITVVVGTRGAKVYVGRCHEFDEERIVLLDADEHADGEGGKSTEAYLDEAARTGVWPRHRTLTLSVREVAWVRPLGEFRARTEGSDRDDRCVS